MSILQSKRMKDSTDTRHCRRQPWVYSKVNQQDIDRVLDAVGDNWRPEVSTGHEVKGSEDRAVDDVFDHAGGALRKMRQTEDKTAQDRGREPTRCRSPENVSKAIHEITAPNRLLAKGRENPGES